MLLKALLYIFYSNHSRHRFCRLRGHARLHSLKRVQKENGLDLMKRSAKNIESAERKTLMSDHLCAPAFSHASMLINIIVHTTTEEDCLLSLATVSSCIKFLRDFLDWGDCSVVEIFLFQRHCVNVGFTIANDGEDKINKSNVLSASLSVFTVT